MGILFQMALAQNQTVVYSGVIFCSILVLLQLFSGFLASTPQLRILGGFFCSLLYFFSIVLIGSIESEPSWISVIFSAIIAMVVGSTVHPMCITTSLLFSIGWTFYFWWAAQRIHA